MSVGWLVARTDSEREARTWDTLSDTSVVHRTKTQEHISIINTNMKPKATMTRGGRICAAFLQHINLILAVICGAALVESQRIRQAASEGEVYQMFSRLELVVTSLPYLALLTMLLAHLALLALQVSDVLGRRLLLLYSIASVCASLLMVSLWALLATDVAAALQAADPTTAERREREPFWRDWMRPLLVQEDGVEWGAVCGVAAAVLVPLLLLLAAALALYVYCKVEREKEPCFKRCYSVHYESTALSAPNKPRALSISDHSTAVWD